MSTVSELSKQGVTKMRLPNWHEAAYLHVPPDGPWATLYDIGAGVDRGEPRPILIVECDKHTEWEPCP